MSLYPPRLAFLAWSGFHARSRFAPSSVPEEKWGLLVVYNMYDHTVITHLAGWQTKREGKKTRGYIIQKPNMPLFRLFQGTTASFAIQIGFFSITLEPRLPSPSAAFSQAFSVNSFR